MGRRIPRQAIKWLQSYDTGVSSLVIWRTLAGETPEDVDVPHDPDDFSRCYRLLQVMPQWRPRLHEVARKYPAWRPFVKHWDELTALYEEGVRTQWKPPYVMYERMKALRFGVSK